MASDSPKVVALFSIRPRYAEMIMAGVKKVEFRKTRFRRGLSHVVVYASSPIQKVVGYFSVNAVEVGSPAELWARYNGASGMTQNEFQAYYGGDTRGTAISIGDVCCFHEKVPLSALGDGLTAPQSFSYLDPEAIGVLRRICRDEWHRKE